jgi:hypothetical protein
MALTKETLIGKIEVVGDWTQDVKDAWIAFKAAQEAELGG